MLSLKSDDIATYPAVFDEAAFSAHLEDLRARRDEFRDQRHISQDIVEAWQGFGIYRAFVPDELGGSGLSANEFLRLIERISEADGSAGWVASFGFASKYLQSLPADTLREIYSDGPDIVFAGAVFPPQPAKTVEGGVRVTGRWKFGSGCMGASLIGVGISIKGGDFGGLPLMAVMPADKVRIEETWDTIGMTASGISLPITSHGSTSAGDYRSGCSAGCNRPYFRHCA